MYEDFGLIIQGEISKYPKNLIKTLKTHSKEFKEIVVSCWGHEDTSVLKDFKVKLVTNPLFKKVIQDNTIEWQIESTLAGLEEIVSPYVIKIRADESFDNLGPIVKAVRKNPWKYTTCNIFFLPPTQPHEILHPSDHLIGSKTEYLLNGFRAAKKLLAKWHQNPFKFKYTNNIGIEAWLFCSFLKGNNVDISKACDTIEGAREILKSYAECIDINLLGKYSWWCNKINYEDDRYLYENGYNKSIKHIDEL